MKKRNRNSDSKGNNVTKLLVAMTGKASAAEAAEGDKPVFDYIASLPQPQRGIAERIDGLAAKTLSMSEKQTFLESHSRRRPVIGKEMAIGMSVEPCREFFRCDSLVKAAGSIPTPVSSS